MTVSRNPLLLGLALTLVGVALGAVFFFSAKPGAQASQKSAVALTPVPIPAHRDAPPNLPPSAGVHAVSHPGGGLITVDDVRAFVNAHGFVGSRGGKTTTGAAPAVLEVTLMTWEQAGVILKGDGITGRNLADQVIYVKLQGPFLLDIPMPPAAEAHNTPVQTGYELFDVKTGNLIVFGTTG